MKNNNIQSSVLLERMRQELEQRRGTFADVAKAANVSVDWLHSVMKKSNKDADHGVKRCERVLKALGVEVILND